MAVLFLCHVVTFNVNCVGNLIEFLKTTDAHLVLAQELRVLPAGLTELQTKLARLGWKSVVQPAVVAVSAASGGVGIFARAAFGLRPPEAGQVVSTTFTHRAVAAVIDIPGDASICCYSCYFTVGEGMGYDNSTLAHDLGRHMDVVQLPVLAGGDMNMSPCDMLASGFPETAGLRLVAPPPGVATCVTCSASNVLDFFAVRVDLARCVKAVHAQTDVDVHPHRPVHARFHERVMQLKYLTFARPQDLPRDPPAVGPRNCPEDWKPVLDDLNSTIDALPFLSQGNCVKRWTGTTGALHSWRRVRSALCWMPR